MVEQIRHCQILGTKTIQSQIDLKSQADIHSKKKKEHCVRSTTNSPCDTRNMLLSNLSGHICGVGERCMGTEISRHDIFVIVKANPHLFTFTRRGHLSVATLKYEFGWGVVKSQLFGWSEIRFPRMHVFMYEYMRVCMYIV